MPSFASSGSFKYSLRLTLLCLLAICGLMQPLPRRVHSSSQPLSQPLGQPQPQQSFAPEINTGALNTAREGHTATLLQNGKVLVAGGRDGGTSHNTAEVYDPVSATWSATANTLSNARYGHSAVLLRNGQVLVIGGQGSNGSLDTAEIYDPTANTWSALLSRMNAPRFHATATLLTNGRVLVTGGMNSGGYLRSAELYDPATRNWTRLDAGNNPAGNLTDARAEHSATLLTDGRVLVAGGFNGSAAFKTAELFEPNTNSWRRVGDLITARRQHTATLLPDNTVLVAGGLNGATALNSSETYNSATSGWTASGNLANGRRAQTATLLPNGRVFVAGGRDSGGNALSTAEVYNFTSRTWGGAPLAPPFPSNQTFTLAEARSDHTATIMPNGQVLLTGGQSGGSALNSAELYEYATGSWGVTKNPAGAPTQMTALRAGHTATLLPHGKVLVAGGRSLSGSSPVALNSAELYDPNTGTWTATGSLNQARYNHTATLLPNGKVLVAGGKTLTQALDSAELYDPVTGFWTTTPAPGVARYHHTATLLPNGLVLVVGGDIGGGQRTASVQLYDPANGVNGSWSNAPNLSQARAEQTATLLPNGTVLVFGGLLTNAAATRTGALFTPSGSSGAWTTLNITDTSASTPPAFRYGHTATLLPTNRVLMSGGRGGTVATDVTKVIGHSEIYNIATRTFEAGRATTASRIDHTATLLPNGKVLLFGGRTISASSACEPAANPVAQIFDPFVSVGSATSVVQVANPVQARNIHTATLLANGQVLVVGGYSPEVPPNCTADLLRHTELYDPGLGYQESWRPVISFLTGGASSSNVSDARLQPDQANLVTVNGAHLQGISEASGHGAQSAASNYPVAQVLSLSNEQLAFIPLNSASGWTNNAFNYTPLSGFAPGPALLTLYANGIPSVARVVNSNGSDFVFPNAARTGTISGRVIYHNGEGIVANVTLAPEQGSPAGCTPARTITTAPNGEFVFRALVISPTPQTSPPTIDCSTTRILSQTAANGGFIVSYSLPTVTPAGTAITCTPASGSVFPFGSTTITCTATNSAGSASCTNVYTIANINCPPNQTSGTSGNGVAVTYPAPTIQPSNFSATCAPASGSFFPLGTTTVTCRVNQFQSVNCSFTVTVQRAVGLQGKQAGESGESPAAPIGVPAKGATSGAQLSKAGSAEPSERAGAIAIEQQQQTSCRYRITPAATAGNNTLAFFPASGLFNMVDNTLSFTGPPESLAQPAAEPSQTGGQNCTNCVNNVFVSIAPFWNLSGRIQMPGGAPVADVNLEFSVPYAILDDRLTCQINGAPVSCKTAGAKTINNDNCARASANLLDPFAEFHCACTNENNGVCEKTVLARYPIPANFAALERNTTFSWSAFDWRLPLFQVNPNGTFNVANVPNGANAVVTPLNRTGGTQYSFSYQPPVTSLPTQPFIRIDQVGQSYDNQIIIAQTACTAPTITTQPANQTACAGSPATFSVSASGTGLSYQWRKAGVNINGATASSYTIAAVAAADAANYDVVVNSSCGSLTSSAVSLTVNATTAITAQPTNQAACLGGSATFTAGASGTGLSYQWRKSGVNINGATASSYTIAAVAAGDAANYDVVVNGACGSLTSSAVTLALNSATSINTQPANQTACIGAPATFTAAASGSGTVSFQWRKGGGNISGATSNSFTIPSVTAGDAGGYDVVVASGCGTVTSAMATLTVNNATAITTQPANQTVCAGAPATFSVAAAGTGLAYQWRKGGVNVSGATGSTYTISSVVAGDAGNYDVVITGTCGAVTSAAAALAVNATTAIATQPANQAACPGGSATLTVGATGAGLSYQWRKGGVNIAGATGSSYTLAAVGAGDAAQYDVLVSGTCGSLTSAAATLTINAATTINTQPANQVACPGGAATFSVVAAGAGTLSFQWRKGGVNIPGATGSSFVINPVAAGDAGNYDVVVTSNCGATTSNPATLTVNAATAIAAQPQTQTVCLGAPASFSVTAAGTNLSYQWRKNGANIGGATGSTYSLAATMAADADNYDVVITGACGSVTSNAVALIVNNTTAITAQPSQQTVCAGNNATFSVTAAGAGLTYQWRKGGVAINGATGNSFTISAAAAADAGNYDVVVTGACGGVTSNSASLIVNAATAIGAQPANQTVCAGNSATFNVSATGAGLTYQWRKGGVAINGATGSSYTINAAAAADAAQYDVVATGSCGTVTSNAATLTVNATTALTAQPANQASCLGGAVTFNVTATGAGLSYQWRKGGVALNGATASSFTIAAVAAGDAGDYAVVVSGACGAVTSQAATLSINTSTNINTQPANQTACPGGVATFTVAASGSGLLSYQWRKAGVALNGATAASYTINPVTAADAGSYDVVATSGCGTTTSAAATLTVNNPTAISAQPAGQTVCAGAPVTFNVSATGTNLSYQWRKGGVALNGATASSYTINAAAAGDAANYDVVVTGVCGAVTSNAVPLTVNPTTAISAQPANQAACLGGSVTFNVTATGTGLSYQWRRGGVAINGATASSFTIAAVAAGDAGNYDVVVTGACGTLTSNAATLTLNAATNINTQPANQPACLGGSATFTLAASGTGTLNYQWRKGGVALNGATGSSFTVNPVTAGDAGSYDVVVTGSCGAATSNAATLTVNAFALAASNAAFQATGGTGSVDLTATVGQCTWNAVSNDNWITITSVTSTTGTATNSGTGNGRVNFNVAANAATTARTGTLAIAGLSFTVTQSGSAAAPRLDTLSQTSALAGSAGFTLTLTGASFTNTAVVRWNGSARATGFGSATQLTAQLTTADLVTAGTFTIDVFDPPPGGGASNALSFTVIQPNPVPELASLSPNSMTAGGAAFTLAVIGTKFVNGSVVRWNNADRNTTFVSATQLSAAIPASDIANAGTATVTVFNPAPGGGTSSGQSFTINQAPPPPLFIAMSPNTAVAGGGGFSLTITGGGFTGGTVVRWNGSDRPTTVVSSTSLTVTIPASDIAQSGINQVTIFTPPPGGGTVTAITFVVGALGVNVSSASFARDRGAAEAITSVFGVELATESRGATTLPLPTSLAGTTVKVRDSLGAERLAALFFVSPGQINYLIPAGTAIGAATAIITSGNNKLSVAALDMQIVAPGLFTANANGQGPPAAQLLRVQSNGQQINEPVAQLQGGLFVPRPLDLGPAGEQVFLILYGTGMRGRTSLVNATATLGGLNLPILFLSAQGDLAGLDQVNLGPLPRTLAGRGNVNLVLTVEGRAANTVLLNIQ